MQKCSLFSLFSILALTACGPVPVPTPPASTTPDTTAPTLAQVNPVASSSTDATPNYTFSSSEAGTITYGGDCSSSTTTAVQGNNTITFAKLSVGYHNNCTIQVTDSVGNASSYLAVNAFTILSSMPVNDTGITRCKDYANSAEGYSGTFSSTIVCADVGSTQTVTGTEPVSNDPVPAGQDAVYGRDAEAAAGNLVKTGGGMAGFDFTKLDADGQPLAIQNANWSNSGSEAAGTKWSCVRDNVTGLIWEMKTNDNGFRDKDWTYSWYDSSTSTNGGNAGTADAGDTCINTTTCDIQDYRNTMNSIRLCGLRYWEVPTPAALATLLVMNGSSPAIDTSYFPNTLATEYWTSSTAVFSSSNAWAIGFSTGYMGFFPKSTQLPVRLVHKAP